MKWEVEGESCTEGRGNNARSGMFRDAKTLAARGFSGFRAGGLIKRPIRTIRNGVLAFGKPPLWKTQKITPKPKGG